MKQYKLSNFTICNAKLTKSYEAITWEKLPFVAQQAGRIIAGWRTSV